MISFFFLSSSCCTTLHAYDQVMLCVMAVPFLCAFVLLQQYYCSSTQVVIVEAPRL